MREEPPAWLEAGEAGRPCGTPKPAGERAAEARAPGTRLHEGPSSTGRNRDKGGRSGLRRTG